MRNTEIMVSEEAGVRTLHFGSSWVQGAMRVARPFKLELAYTREMMLSLLLRPWPEGPPRVLLVGLGAGSLVKFLHHHFANSKLTVVEIDPAVHAVAVQHFRFPQEGSNLRVVYADAADFVSTTRQRFDLMLIDGFDPNARMGRLCSQTFFDDCARLLSDQGVFCINLLSRRKEYAVCQQFIEAAFDAAPAHWLPSQDPGNMLGLAGKRPVFETAAWVDDLRAPASVLKSHTGLDLLPSLKHWSTVLA